MRHHHRFKAPPLLPFDDRRRSLVKEAVHLFGPSRILFASNFPVDLFVGRVCDRPTLFGPSTFPAVATVVALMPCILLYVYAARTCAHVPTG